MRLYDQSFISLEEIVDFNSRSQHRQRVGKSAERVAVDYYSAFGHEILATNYHVGAYELDIIARLAGVLVVVEVRHRSTRSWQSAFSSIGRHKRQSLRNALSLLWQQVSDDHSIERVCLDVAAVYFDRSTVSIEIAKHCVFLYKCF